MHTDARWIERWLAAPMQLPDGTLQERDAEPQDQQSVLTRAGAGGATGHEGQAAVGQDMHRGTRSAQSAGPGPTRSPPFVPARGRGQHDVGVDHVAADSELVEDDLVRLANTPTRVTRSTHVGARRTSISQSMAAAHAMRTHSPARRGR